MRLVMLLIVGLGSTLAGSACTGNKLDAAGVTVRDSAGVQIVHLSESVVRDAPPLEAREVVRVGTADGPEETQFFRLAAAVEVDDEIFTLDMGDHRVRVFGLDGAFRRGFGREGGGPGEFRRPRLLYVLGDTVAVQGQRLNLLDRNGEPLATGRGRVAAPDGFLVYTVPTAAGWLGTWYTRNRERLPPGRSFRDTVIVYHVDPLTGDLGEVVHRYLRPETRIAGEIGFYLTPYFQAQPTHTIGENGRVYVTDGEAYRIDVIGPDGHLERRIEAAFTPPPVTAGMVDAAIEAERLQVANAPPGSESATYAEVIDRRANLPAPETRPVFGRMIASATGRLAALRLDLDPDPNKSGDASTWDVFDETGRLEGRVILPPLATILSLTNDGCLANVRDDLGIQYLVKYRF